MFYLEFSCHTFSHYWANPFILHSLTLFSCFWHIIKCMFFACLKVCVLFSGIFIVGENWNMKLLQTMLHLCLNIYHLSWSKGLIMALINIRVDFSRVCHWRGWFLWVMVMTFLTFEIMDQTWLAYVAHVSKYQRMWN